MKLLKPCTLRIRLVRIVKIFRIRFMKDLRLMAAYQEQEAEDVVFLCRRSYFRLVVQFSE